VVEVKQVYKLARRETTSYAIAKLVGVGGSGDDTIKGKILFLPLFFFTQIDC
jgi:hypothetical protein